LRRPDALVDGDSPEAGSGRGPAALRDRMGHAGALSALDKLWPVIRSRAPAADCLTGLELHKSGARHAHSLVAGVPEGFRFESIAGWWFDHYGFNRWELVHVPEAAARYAGKYVAKELGAVRIAFGGGDFR
jgi:hypothetical protein